MKHKMLCDLHTHTTFSHGKGSIEDNVRAAESKGIRTIGISDHGPDHILYGIKAGDIAKMRAEIERLKPIYPMVDILLGVEANIMDPEGKLAITPEEFEDLDYVIAGYHFGVIAGRPFRHSILHLANFVGLKTPAVKKANTDRVIAALHENHICTLVHPGDKGVVDLTEVAKACAETGTLMEISTWHDALTIEGIRECARQDVSFIISSDAHRPQRVGTFSGGLERAKKAGLDLSRIKNLGLTDYEDDGETPEGWSMKKWNL